MMFWQLRYYATHEWKNTGCGPVLKLNFLSLFLLLTHLLFSKIYQNDVSYKMVPIIIISLFVILIFAHVLLCFIVMAYG